MGAFGLPAAGLEIIVFFDQVPNESLTQKSTPQYVPQTSGNLVPPILHVNSIIFGPFSVSIKSTFEMVFLISRDAIASSTILRTTSINSASFGCGHPCPRGIRRGGAVVTSLWSMRSLHCSANNCLSTKFFTLKPLFNQHSTAFAEV